MATCVPSHPPPPIRVRAQSPELSAGRLSPLPPLNGPGGYVEAQVGAVTLQWHSPLVLLQSGSKPLPTSQLHGPHVGCPHQPRGQGWSILQRGAQADMSPLCHPRLLQPCVALLTVAVAQPGSRGSERHPRDRLRHAPVHLPGLTIWPKVILGTLAGVAVGGAGLSDTHGLMLTWVQVTHVSTVVAIVTWDRKDKRLNPHPALALSINLPSLHLLPPESPTSWL